MNKYVIVYKHCIMYPTRTSRTRSVETHSQAMCTPDVQVSTDPQGGYYVVALHDWFSVLYPP